MALPDTCVLVDTDTSAASGGYVHTPNEWPTIFFSESTEGSATVTLKDRSGDDYDLTAGTYTVTLNVKEFCTDAGPQITKECTITPPSTVSVTLEADDLPFAGVWIGEFTVTDDDSSDKVIARFRMYLDVSLNYTSTNASYCPLTVAEIRLLIRDRHPEENTFLEEVEFSDTEIAFSIRRPVDIWNESLPPIMKTYTPLTFPYRYHWSEGVIGELYRMASFNLNRNDVDVATGGVTVDDKRADIYLKLSEEYISRYKQWVMSTKYSVNIGEGFGRTSIGYF